MSSTSWLRGRAVSAAPARLRFGATVIRCSDGRLSAAGAAVADVLAQFVAIEKQPGPVAMMGYAARAHQGIDPALRTCEKRRSPVDIDEPREIPWLLLRQERRDSLSQSIQQLIADP